jgi:two-component system, sensor histidine kinase YesM
MCYNTPPMGICSPWPRLRAFRSRSRTLQSSIFFAFSAFLIFLILTFAVTFYFFISSTLKAQAFDSISRLAQSISTQVDSRLQTMNSLTMNMLFSQTIVDLVHKPSLFGEGTLSFKDRRQINELMLLISGIDYPLLQINVIGKDGSFYGFGYGNVWMRLPKAEVEASASVRRALELDGKRLILPPHPDEWKVDNKTVVSLLRSFSPSWGLPVDMVIELQLDYSKLFNLVSGIERGPKSTSANELKTWVFDESGAVVYPDPSDKDADPGMAAAIWSDLRQRPPGAQTWSARHLKAGRSILAKTRSDFSLWTVAVSESESKLLEPVRNFGNAILLAGLLVLAFSLMLSWAVSREISKPIKKIYELISGLSLETLHAQKPQTLASGINELEELNSAFREMHGKLIVSLNEIVASRSHEVHSRLLALQAQMNPHFLYNTLVNISIMAEEAGAAEIVKACSDLSSMLRYISREANAKAPVEQELAHAKGYLDLMRIRYPDQLEYAISVPESMLRIVIPRLVIQPLAENSMKYGIERDPPWKLSIEGRQEGDSWRVRVTDNGPGFGRETLERLRAERRLIDPPNSVPELELGGMGLANIYIRLRLHYGGDAHFEIEDLPGGGAAVTIGGREPHASDL